MLVEILLLVCQVVLLGWFTWAVQNHFTKVGGTPKGMKFIIALSSAFFLLQGCQTLTTETRIGFFQVGLVLYLFSGGLFYWAFTVTRKRGLALAFSRDIPPSIVMSGPYGWVRHPFYLSYLIYWLAAPVATGSALLLVIPLIMGLTYWMAAINEEKLLVAGFGEAYKEYQRKVGMLFPRHVAIPALKNLHISETNRETLTTRQASSSVERKKLIQLRTKIYRQVGKHTPSELMTDQFDQDCFLIGVWRGETPVASARVICRAPEQEWEHDRFLRWREDFPRRGDTVEISRFCIERHERSWEVIRLLSDGMIRAALETRRNHVLACCTEELRGFYATFYGARFTGDVIFHDDLGPKPHLIFFSPFTRALLGQGIAPLAWMSLWPPVAAYGLHSGHLGSEMSWFRKYLWLLLLRAVSALTPAVSRGMDWVRCLMQLLRGQQLKPARSRLEEE